MIAHFVVPNRQKLVPYLRPIDADASWRVRVTALLQTTPVPMCLGDVLAAFELEDHTAPPDRATEGYWAALAQAESRGKLNFEHATVLNSASKVTIGADEDEPGPSLVRELIEGQHTAVPMYQSPRATGASIAQTTTAGLSEEDAREWQKRIAVVRAKSTYPDMTWADLASRFDVTKREARYYWAEFEVGGEAELRPKQRKLTGLRVEDEVIDTITKLYKHSRTFQATAIYEHPELRDCLARLKAAGRPAKLTYDQLSRFVREVLKPNRTYEAMRTGKKRLPSPQASGQVDELKSINELLNVIQVDATWVDCHLLGSDGELVQRMKVLYAIDVASRCLWAWRICLSEPIEFDYLRLIQMGIRPKGDLVKQLGARHDYPVYGVPQRILADRGWIFAAQHSRERVTGFGTMIEHAAPYRPEMKGIIERFIGTVNTRFIHRLPGTTKGSIKARGGRDAEDEARRFGLTVSAFERYLSLAVIEGYSDELHTSVGCTPLEQWERLSMQQRGRTWPSDPASQLQLDLLGMLDTGETRLRTSVGYEFGGLVFRPERADAPQEARILQDPDDYRSIGLVHAKGPLKGTYGGDATVRDLPKDTAIPWAFVPDLKAQIGPIGPRTGAERMTELLAEIEPTKGSKKAASPPQSKRRATKAEKAVRAAVRNARGDALPPEEPFTASDEPEPDELMLEPEEFIA